MKKYDLLWALMVLPVFITGCSDDDLDMAASSTPAVAGDEIVFAAEASYESGSAQTRTVYGDKGDGYQIINWEEGDMVRIDCAAAANAKSANYKVYSITDGSTSENEDTESTAAQLIKEGDGLQWGTGEHTFYAVYPSPAYFGEDRDSTQGRTTLSGSTVTGVIPVTQTPKSVEKDVTIDGVTYAYVFEPNMDYAYMAARAVYNASTEGGEGVTLHFKPLVTAIEVNLNIGEINLNTGNAQQLTLNSVSLYTTGSQPMSGSFSADISELNTDEYTISGASITDMNESGTANNYVTLNLNTAIEEGGVVLDPDDKCLFTFFINPSATFDDGNTDLKLYVNYTCDGVNTTKNYTIGKGIEAHKKYFFNNITLPNISSEINVSRWFSYVADDIYISQLSIPGAGNAASYNYSGNNPSWYMEQTMSLTEQWNAGVRCFELVSDRASSGTSDDNLSSENLTCNNTSVRITFSSALTTLTDLLKAYPNECLIIICNYQPNMSRNAQYYMDNLSNTFSDNSYNDIEFVKLQATSTAGDIRGKMTFIGRITQEGEDSSTSLTNVPDWLTYIEGWGSLKDRWNRRFGDEYNPVYNKDSGTNVEDDLFSVSRPNSSVTYPDQNPNFLYNISSEGTAWVQEWMRVVPENGVQSYQVGSRGSGNNTTYLYFNWPGSYNEKYENIVTTIERAKSEYDTGTGNTLYINSLCGYYVNNSIQTSYIPYVSGNSVTIDRNIYTLNTTGGLGGNFSEYNEAMNTRVYSYLLNATQNNTTGPLGIVMMDYIGSNDAGIALPSLIIQNNFSFPLRTRTTE